MNNEKRLAKEHTMLYVHYTSNFRSFYLPDVTFKQSFQHEKVSLKNKINIVEIDDFFLLIESNKQINTLYLK